MNLFQKTFFTKDPRTKYFYTTTNSVKMSLFVHLFVVVPLEMFWIMIVVSLWSVLGLSTASKPFE